MTYRRPAGPPIHRGPPQPEREGQRSLRVHGLRSAFFATSLFAILLAYLLAVSFTSDVSIDCARTDPDAPMSCSATQSSIVTVATRRFTLEGDVRAERAGSGEDQECILVVGNWRAQIPSDGEAAASVLRACEADASRPACITEVRGSRALRLALASMLLVVIAVTVLQAPRTLTVDRQARCVRLSYRLFGLTLREQSWLEQDVDEVILSEERGTDASMFEVQLRMGSRFVLVTSEPQRPAAESMANEVRALLAWLREDDAAR
jgi:hypothetical protein